MKFIFASIYPGILKVTRLKGCKDEFHGPPVVALTFSVDSQGSCLRDLDTVSYTKICDATMQKSTYFLKILFTIDTRFTSEKSVHLFRFFLCLQFVNII